MAAKAGTFGSRWRSGGVAVLMLLIWVLISAVPAGATTLPTTVAENMVLSAAGSPYTGTSVTVASGVTLTAEPGTVIKITGLLTVKGVLTVNGTAEAPVTFTSRKDDSVGGDTNGDGSATTPKAGNWSGIEFPASTGGSASSTLTHVRVLYGGSSTRSMVEIKCPCANPPKVSHSYLAHTPSQAIGVIQGDPSITESTIEDNAGSGIMAISASPHIYGNTISGNNIGISFAVESGEHGSVDINDNLVEGNKSTGISIVAGSGFTHIDSASMGNNVIKGNGGKAIKYETFSNSSESAEFVGNPIPPNLTTNTLSGNKENGIWVAGRIAESTNWEPSGYSLVVFSKGLNIGKGATLTLGAGAVIKNEARSIYVHGTLTSLGTSEAPVTLTSSKDDSVGGDTNGDGSATAPAPGDWHTLEFPAEGGASVITHTRILYGGETLSPFESMVEIKCPCASSPEFANSTIAYSARSGINIHAGNSPSITESTIEDNAGSGIMAVSASPHIYGNTISGNNIGISFAVESGEHGSVDVNDNLVEGNESTGISIAADSGFRHIDSASMGNNVIKGNGGKAIKYETFSNSSESAEFVGNPIPPNLTTNTLSGNKENGIWVAGRIAESTNWEPSGYSLVVFSKGLNIGKGATLTLGAGAVIKNEARSIYVHGTLTSLGTSEAPVTLTSSKDDSVGGDTNGDGSATAPAPGDWGEIEYPSAKDVNLEYLDIRYAEIAFDLKYLDSMTVANSDFVYNEKAFEVALTEENSPELSALACVPPYLSFVISDANWYGRTGLPAPDTDISGAIGAALPTEYAPLFDAAASLAELDFSLYGTDNTIPFSIYSCPALGIPPTPVTPIAVLNTPLAPHFPDPEVE